MAQQLKAEVRERILAAAAEVFAREGYEGARLADIAARAGISTGNIYRYFADKEVLFAEVVPRSLAAELVRRLRARVRELRGLDDWRRATVGGSTQADALLDFWIEHRLAVVILLSGARGSSLGHVRPLVEAELTRLTVHHARSQGQPLSPEVRLVLEQLFRGTVDMIVHLLQAQRDPAAIRRSFAAFWSFQLAGLQGLLRSAPDAPRSA